MEVLVSLSVFVIATMAIFSIYIATLKASQKTTALTRVQNEAQFIMEVLVKKIRTSIVDYSVTYNSNGDSELFLIDAAGDNYAFKHSGNLITVSVNGGPEKAMPASNINITDLVFYVVPITNPFSLHVPPSTQPRVTLIMKVASTQVNQSANITVQQSVPQRTGLIE